MILLLILACGDPQLREARAALDAYDAGKVLLDAGKPREAAARFGEAALHDQNSPELLAWQAQALSDAGEGSAAIELLTQGLSRFPDDPTLRYNRAAALVHDGALDAAAADLRALYSLGLADPVEVGDDPDFAALQADSRFSDLAPAPQVDLSARGEPGPVLLGDTWTLELSVSARRGELLSITDMGEPTGLLRHTRTVEDIASGDARVGSRTLTITWRAVAPGDGTLGPWLVAVGGQSALTPSFPVSVIALSRPAILQPDEAGTVYSVEALLAPTPAVWAGRLLGRVAARAPADASVTVTPEAGEADADPIRLELRRDGQPEAGASLYRVAGPARVQITRAGASLLDQQVP